MFDLPTLIVLRTLTILEPFYNIFALTTIQKLLRVHCIFIALQNRTCFLAIEVCKCLICENIRFLIYVLLSCGSNITTLGNPTSTYLSILYYLLCRRYHWSCCKMLCLIKNILTIFALKQNSGVIHRNHIIGCIGHYLEVRATIFSRKRQLLGQIVARLLLLGALLLIVRGYFFEVGDVGFEV